MKWLRILKPVLGWWDLPKWLAHLVGAVCTLGAEATELFRKHGVF